MLKEQCKGKVEPSRRRRCNPTLSEVGVTCLVEIKELYGISTDSDALEFVLHKVRYDPETTMRSCRMTLNQALRESANNPDPSNPHASVQLAQCLMQSCLVTSDTPR